MIINQARVSTVIYQTLSNKFIVYTKESVLLVCNKPYHTNKKYRRSRRLQFCGTVHYLCREDRDVYYVNVLEPFKY